ncbi:MULTISPECIES: prolipoprotein diacylglyceryl transferase [Blastomonas]|uniref:Phosphatidylglycerol--prolipoprotein diacylglyceryl transferase n=2 Tax=Blastomonas fulva TaxID=1550728 RepID=A0ABM6M4F5_9SPHN|nr:MULTISPECIES: prolipoprotein diacylglyceryl transferase [Blastomonas]AOG00534.1 prolipoprotein diacylglyceryl transferase [Blastomonas sp. RAC04]ASR50772.1 prolipoprotein diacylglyceryl transferase [Blastomonas fulva]MCO5791783.1 prolipoprotein diacylglyceryl transferase [Blastomonas sp.]MDK2758479.1 prolipoprotein diacylglyceryl transferase [Blastomonas fulva]
MILPISALAANIAAAVTSAPIRFEELGLSPVALSIGSFQLKWYSLAYLFGILLGYWYMGRMLRQPGAPMAQRHADDLMLYSTLGIILGGRLGYVLFYRPDLFETPLAVFKVWEGGMSFHGGLIGVLVAIGYLVWRNGLSYLRVGDYVACVVPFGLLFGRLANFVNAELWGRPTDVPWAVIFPTDPSGLPRHPSQLYEAGLEGALLAIILAVLFWKTDVRHRPGFLGGVFLAGYGASRFIVEYFRNPDAHLIEFAERTGMSMGQWLTVPMILIGLYLMISSRNRVAKPLPVTA